METNKLLAYLNNKRLEFERVHDLLRITKEWDQFAGHYDSDVGEKIVNKFNNWLDENP
jgi:hypothetical protein